MQLVDLPARVVQLRPHHRRARGARLLVEHVEQARPHPIAAQDAIERAQGRPIRRVVIERDLVGGERVVAPPELALVDAPDAVVQRRLLLGRIGERELLAVAGDDVEPAPGAIVQPPDRAQRRLVRRLEREHAPVRGERLLFLAELRLEHAPEAVQRRDLIVLLGELRHQLLEDVDERLPALRLIERGGEQDERRQIGRVDGERVAVGLRRLVGVGHALAPQPPDLALVEADQLRIGDGLRLPLVDGDDVAPALFAPIERVERGEGGAMAGHEIEAALVERDRVRLIAEAPLDEIGDVEVARRAPLGIADALGLAQIHVGQIAPALGGAVERAERLQRRHVRRHRLERRAIGGDGVVEAAEVRLVDLADAVVQIGALLGILDERQLGHVDVDELAPARVRLEHGGELAQRRRLVGRGHRRAAIGADGVLGVAEALPVEIAGALAQAALRARIVDEIGLGHEHARQLAPVLLQQRQRRQRRRRRQVGHVVVERDLVGGARGGALIEHDLLDLPGAVAQHRAEDDVAGGVGHRRQRGHELLPVALGEVELGERFEHGHVGRVDLARFLERDARVRQVAGDELLDGGDVDEQRHALVRIADERQLRAAELERALPALRDGGVAAREQGDPALAHQARCRGAAARRRAARPPPSTGRP